MTRGRHGSTVILPDKMLQVCHCIIMLPHVTPDCGTKTFQTGEAVLYEPLPQPQCSISPTGYNSCPCSCPSLTGGSQQVHEVAGCRGAPITSTNTMATLLKLILDASVGSALSEGQSSFGLLDNSAKDLSVRHSISEFQDHSVNLFNRCMSL